MEITNDKKQEVMLDLLQQLMTEMKGSAGRALMPHKEETVIAVEPKDKSEGMEDALDAIPEPDDMDDVDHSDLMDDEDDCEPKHGASARLDRLMKR